MSEWKITASHLRRPAVIYVRQSTLAQVERNRESTARQYDLAARARELGWPASAVTVIDEDLGISGRSAASRAGFAEGAEPDTDSRGNGEMEGTEVGDWRKASYSGNGGGSCVEVGQAPDAVLIRDTKQAGRDDRTVLAFDVGTWAGFLATIKLDRCGP